MARLPRPLVLLAVAAGLLPAPLPGQSAGRGPLLLELPPGVTALSMGGAFPAAGESAEALLHNPALLTDARDVGVSVQRYGSRGSVVSAFGGGAWLSGGVGIAVAAGSYGAPSGVPAAAGGDEGVLVRSGPVGAGELTATVGYAREVAGLRVGVAGKVVEQRLGSARDATVAADAGVAADLGPVTAGVAVRDVGPALSPPGGRLPLPHRITAGAAFEGWWVGPLDVGASATVTRQWDGEWAGGVGTEIAYWPVRGRTFIVRAGLRRVPRGPAEAPTLGAAFEGDAIVVEYAFEPFDGVGDAHRIGLRWKR